MRFKKYIGGVDLPPASFTYEQVSDVENAGVENAGTVNNTETTHESPVVDLNTKRFDALSWHTIAKLAIFVFMTMVIYLTWFAYVKPDTL
jgi:hypothetical protein